MRGLCRDLSKITLIVVIERFNVVMGKNVKRCKNVISIYKMNHPACVSSFLLSLKEGIAAGYDNFQICRFGDQVYPNACVYIENGKIFH